ncbi:MAG: RNA-splicing ligase RtcB [candidate division WS2 bacterium]|nr:RNA-splicing ligase RtcB [Candidatus Lithacetigena glycinireducens]
MNKWKGSSRRIDDYRIIIPPEYKPGMKVPGIIYVDEGLWKTTMEEQAPEQVANVATLPGLLKYSLAMPDIHWGYGFPIGGVAAFETADGIITPGGIGYDINCGVRLLRTDLTLDEVKNKIELLLETMFRNVPSGLGSKGKVKVNQNELDSVLTKGARFAVERGYGTKEDLVFTEENGEMKGADPQAVSLEAKRRGFPQLGSLGSGNHFLEIQVVDTIYDEKTADAFGLKEGQITFLIHSGSRGLGHQVATDYIKIMERASQKYQIKLVDRQLACTPLNSEEGKKYFSAMVGAANYAWANRQMITHWVRESFEEVFKSSWEKLGLKQVYDVAHNIAKIEKHIVDGVEKELIVHRKGATRAFPVGRPEIPDFYKNVGQPVLIPGDMGRYSYVLVGTQKGLEETWGSTCHGAGRVMSRTATKKGFSVQELIESLKKKGILVKAESKETLVEEAPEAYKDVSEVVNVVHGAGISRKVCRMKPLGVTKG